MHITTNLSYYPSKCYVLTIYLILCFLYMLLMPCAMCCKFNDAVVKDNKPKQRGRFYELLLLNILTTVLVSFFSTVTNQEIIALSPRCIHFISSLLWQPIVKDLPIGKYETVR